MNVNKNGVINESSFSTTLLSQYDTNFYVEPDGSVWIRIFHHANPATKLFSSSDSFSTSVYKDKDRWFNVSLCNLVSGSWELMIKQTTTALPTETKYRWIQKYNPMTATFEQVTSSNIIKNNSSGYAVSSGANGVYLASTSSNSQCYLIGSDASKGNWFGAIGSWSAYQGGTPAYNDQVFTTGYMDLYLRVDNITNTKVIKNKVGFIANDFIEL